MFNEYNFRLRVIIYTHSTNYNYTMIDMRMYEMCHHEFYNNAVVKALLDKYTNTSNSLVLIERTISATFVEA